MIQVQKLNDEILLIENALRLGKLKNAKHLLDRALKLAPKNSRVNELFAYFLGARGESKRAFEQLRKACELEVVFPSAFYELGRQYLYANQFCDAIKYLELALERGGPNVEGLHDLGIALASIGDLHRAKNVFEGAHQLNPGTAEVIYNLGKVYDDLGMVAEAVKSYSKAVSIDPKLTSAYINLGDINVDIANYEEALTNYNAALMADPSNNDALVNRGVTFHLMKRFDEALSSFDHAILINKNCAGAHFNKALTLISLGRYQEGWEEYEWRWAYERFTSPLRIFNSPLWLGKESLNGKTIFIYSEQGLGDTIQFCRYLILLGEKVDSIFVEVEQSLISIIESMGLGIKITQKGEKIPEHDYHCPMMSLPLAIKTHNSLPPYTHRYLTANRELVASWQARLGKVSIPRVGIVWRGSAGHQNDRNRSIGLNDLMAYLPEGCQYISLQKDPTQNERLLLESNPIYLNYSEHLDDFQDTAALVASLDLVIGVDTSTIHLSGALGVNTWLLLSYVQDWRWPPTGCQSPWYKSMRILRQSPDQEWAPVLDGLRLELLRFIELHSKDVAKQTL